MLFINHDTKSPPYLGARPYSVHPFLKSSAAVLFAVVSTAVVSTAATSDANFMSHCLNNNGNERTDRTIFLLYFYRDDPRKKH